MTDGKHEREPEPTIAEFNRVIRQAAEDCMKQLQPLVTTFLKIAETLAQHPVIRYLVEHPELMKQRPPQTDYDLGSCHCLCTLAHPGLTVCLGEADTLMSRASHTTGLPYSIPVCRPCEREIEDRQAAIARGLRP